MVLGGDSVVGELGAAATKLDPSCNIGLFSALRPAMDLSTAAYRYNQNMMEYYTCEYTYLRVRGVTYGVGQARDRRKGHVKKRISTFPYVHLFQIEIVRI